MTQHAFVDENDERQYWTQTPNIVFELGLKPLEFVLYSHIKRAAGAKKTGKCTKSTATLAKETGIGAGSISRAKAALEKKRPALGNKPLIKTKQVPNPKGGKPFHEITVTDIWKENMARFTSSTVEVEPENQIPVEVETSSKPTSTVEIKKNSKEEPKKERGASAETKIPLLGKELLRDVARLNPPTESLDRYLIVLGKNPDEKFLRQCRAEWLDRGYNKVSWKWFTEWFGSGAIPQRNGNNGNSGKKTFEWQGRYYAMGDVVSDDGDRYTVMGGDGTPSKRWRTPEAFAIDKGIDVEKVRAGWDS